MGGGREGKRGKREKEKKRTEHCKVIVKILIKGTHLIGTWLSSLGCRPMFLLGEILGLD